jgi:scyllo-inositol 2-dehydrogenase (NADP+)
MTIEVGLCSFGMSGEIFHAPLISSEPALSLKSILQRESDSASRHYPCAKIVRRFEDLLTDSTIDLIVVNTPNGLHFPMARDALLAGKHVVVEKPFTVTVSDGIELIDLANRQQRHLAVFHNKRLESDHLSLKQVLSEGLLGRLLEVEWHYDRFRSHVTHKRWKEDDVPGAGTWYDLGVHMVDSMLQLMGRPNSVTADFRILRSDAGAPDYFNVRFDYTDHRVILRSSTFVREPGPIVVAHGTLGSFVKRGGDPQEGQLKAGLRPGNKGWGIDDSPALLHIERGGEVIRKEVQAPNGCYESFYRNIAAAIRGKTPLQFLPTEALLAVEMLEAAQESHRKQRTINLRA